MLIKEYGHKRLQQLDEHKRRRMLAQAATVTTEPQKDSAVRKMVSSSTGLLKELGIATATFQLGSIPIASTSGGGRLGSGIADVVTVSNLSTSTASNRSEVDYSGRADRPTAWLNDIRHQGRTSPPPTPSTSQCWELATGEVSILDDCGRTSGPELRNGWPTKRNVNMQTLETRNSLASDEDTRVDADSNTIDDKHRNDSEPPMTDNEVDRRRSASIKSVPLKTNDACLIPSKSANSNHWQTCATSAIGDTGDTGDTGEISPGVSTSNSTSRTMKNVLNTSRQRSNESQGESIVSNGGRHHFRCHSYSHKAVNSQIDGSQQCLSDSSGHRGALNLLIDLSDIDLAVSASGMAISGTQRSANEQVFFDSPSHKNGNENTPEKRPGSGSLPEVLAEERQSSTADPTGTDDVEFICDEIGRQVASYARQQLVSGFIYDVTSAILHTNCV